MTFDLVSFLLGVVAGGFVTAGFYSLLSKFTERMSGKTWQLCPKDDDDR
jgi:hypothetical protein